MPDGDEAVAGRAVPEAVCGPGRSRWRRPAGALAPSSVIVIGPQVVVSVSAHVLPAARVFGGGVDHDCRRGRRGDGRGGARVGRVAAAGRWPRRGGRGRAGGRGRRGLRRGRRAVRGPPGRRDGAEHDREHGHDGTAGDQRGCAAPCGAARPAPLLGRPLLVPAPGVLALPLALLGDTLLLLVTPGVRRPARVRPWVSLGARVRDVPAGHTDADGTAGPQRCPARPSTRLAGCSSSASPRSPSRRTATSWRPRPARSASSSTPASGSRQRLAEVLRRAPAAPRRRPADPRPPRPRLRGHARLPGARRRRLHPRGRRLPPAGPARLAGPGARGHAGAAVRHAGDLAASRPTSCGSTDGQRLALAGLDVAVVHAPGHTEGSVMFALPRCRRTGAGDGVGARAERRRPVRRLHRAHRPGRRRPARR